MSAFKRRPGAPFMRDGKMVWPCSRCDLEFTRPDTRGEHYLSRETCRARPAVAGATGDRRISPPWKLFEKLVSASAKSPGQVAAGLRLERRIPQQVSGTAYRLKGALDFEGDFQGLAVVLDAKSCGSAVFPLASLAPHQALRLDKAWQRGAAAFVLLDMREPGLVFAVPWPLLRRYMGAAAERRSIPLAVLEAEAIAVGRVLGRAVRLDLVAACAAVIASRRTEVAT